MKKVAIATDSNSGITQAEAQTLGIRVLPMPFYINEELFFEDVTLTQEAFYRRLAEDADIFTRFLTRMSTNRTSTTVGKPLSQTQSSM